MAQSAQDFILCERGDGSKVCNGSPGDDIFGTELKGNVFAKGGQDFTFTAEGNDNLNGGKGIDGLDALDGDPDDVLDCGPGNDFFAADEDDTVRNCENDFLDQAEAASAEGMTKE